MSSASTDRFLVEEESKWLEHYYREGYVILKGVIAEVHLAQCRAACTELTDRLANRLLAEGKIKTTLADADFEARIADLFRDCTELLPNLWRKELHLPGFFGVLCNVELLEAIQKIITNADSIRIFPNYSCRPKTKHGVHNVVWHQDAGLTESGAPNKAPAEARLAAFGIGNVVNCWTPLVSATAKNGAMKFIPKSQNAGILRHVQIGMYSGVDGSGNDLQERALKQGPDAKKRRTGEPVAVGSYITTVDPEAIKSIKDQAIDVECEPGDVVLFSNILVHKGGENTTEKVRWSLDWRFQDASKPTHRPESGHIVAAKGASDQLVSSPEQWATLGLT